MPRKRKIIVYVATSADGFIARPDGDVGWLDRPTPKGMYGMGEFYKSVDTCLLGRKTYEVAVGFGMPQGYSGKKNYVFSRTLKSAPHPSIQVVSNVARFVRSARKQTGKDIWLTGGAELVAAFLDAGEVDEFIIHVIPVLIGEGIPLIAPRHREVKLKLVGSKAYPDGVLQVHYRVGKRR
jgi:dihydrofolate reductase